MGLNWYRTSQGGPGYASGGFWQCAIGNGAVYKRVRWSWGFAGHTSDMVDMDAMHNNVMAAGLVTTIGNGTETPPNAFGSSDDVDPPTQRWLWWEVRQPIALAIDHGAGVIEWRDSGVQEIPDVKSQVLATGLPGGDTLNLWFSWASAAGDWDPSGAALIWVATSVLYSTP